VVDTRGRQFVHPACSRENNRPWAGRLYGFPREMKSARSGAYSFHKIVRRTIVPFTSAIALVIWISRGQAVVH
jgi:hypothetical protein